MDTWSGTLVLLAIIATVITSPGQENLLRSSRFEPVATKISEHVTLKVTTNKDTIDSKDIEESKSNESNEYNAAVNYTGAQLWHLSAKKSNLRSVVSSLQMSNLLSEWGGNDTNVDILVHSNSIYNVTQQLKNENVLYKVVTDNLQKKIDEENPPLNEYEAQLQNRNGHNMTWQRYHRLADIYGFMDYLAQTYPATVKVLTIGKSYEKRDMKAFRNNTFIVDEPTARPAFETRTSCKSIPKVGTLLYTGRDVLKISNGKKSNRAVFIEGCIHGREWISAATVTYFMNQIAEHFDTETDVIRNIDWYFLPVTNPDGYEYTHTTDRLWRKTRKPGGYLKMCTGTDLNRNFGYKWGGKGGSSMSCRDTYSGDKAFSESESKAVADFIKTSAIKFTAYLSYHSYGQFILYPWSYDTIPGPDRIEMDRVAHEMAQAINKNRKTNYAVGLSSIVVYPASGVSFDWAKSQGVKYAYGIELPDKGFHGFILPSKYIEPVATENLDGLRMLARQMQ